MVWPPIAPLIQARNNIDYYTDLSRDVGLLMKKSGHESPLDWV